MIGDIKMPKGFNNKAIEGFTQWMTATLNESNLNKNEVKETVDKTRVLLKEGFPQVRRN